jgi:hypothetical protein
MTKKAQDWQLQRGIKMSEETAAEVAKIACALKALSMFTTLMIDREDCPKDLQQTVDEGVAAIDKLFV